jgi:hypothetical protein
MPSVKKSTKTEETVAAPAPAVEKKTTKASKAEVAAPAPAPAPAKASSTKSASTKSDSKSASTKSEKSASTKKDAPAAAPAKAEKKPKTPREPKQAKEAAPAEEAKAAEEPRVRVSPPTKESLAEDFEALKTKITGIIEELRASGQKNAGIANWKNVLKTVKQLQQDSNRVANSSTKRAPRKASNSEGGFHKKVPITPELSKFCSSHAAEVSKAFKAMVDAKTVPAEKYTEWKSSDWVVNEPSTRSKVTKFLCDYVKAKDLQLEGNRKFFKVDNDMKNLFKLKENDKDNDGKPITFCTLQKLLVPFYPKVEKAQN